MTNTKLRPLTESSLLTAITVIIAIAGIYIPFVILFWTLPITIITARHDLKYGCLSVLISGILLCLFLTPVTAVPLVVGSVPLALTLGFGFYHNWSAVKLFASGFVASGIGVALFLIVTFYLTGINLFVDQLTTFKSAMLDTNNAFSSVGITSEAMIDAKKQTEQIVNTLALVLPMMFLLNALVKLIINYLASGYILKRLGDKDIKTLPPFTLWHFPRFFVYVYAFSLIGLYWGTTRDISLLYQVALNIYLFANILGLVQGLAVIRFFYKLKNWPTAIWVFIIIMIFLNMVIAQMIALAGIFDMIFNYRKKFRMNNK